MNKFKIVKNTHNKTVDKKGSARHECPYAIYTGAIHDMNVTVITYL